MGSKRGDKARINQQRKRSKEELTTGFVMPKWSQISSHPSENLTPQKLANILKEAETGEVYRQMELFEDLEDKDLHLFSQLQTRKLAVTGLDYEVISNSDDPKDKEIAKFVEDIFKNIDDWESAVLDMLDAIGKGFSTLEINWNYRDGDFIIENFTWLHQKHFFWDDNNTFKIRTEDFPMGTMIPKYKVLVHQYKAKSGVPSKAGILRAAAWAYIFKNYSIKDWATFLEIYGMPLRVGMYDDSTTVEDKRRLMEAVVRLGSDAAGIIHRNTSIEFIDNVSKGTSGDLYEKFVNFWDRAVSKAILGQTLTSEVGSNGSYAASKTHNEVRQDLTEADCRALMGTIKKQIIKPLVLFNFGADYENRLPSYKIKYEPPEDTMEIAKTYKVVINGIGLPVAKSHVYEKLGIPEPQDHEELVIPMAIQQTQQRFQVVSNRSSVPIQKNTIVDLDEAGQVVDSMVNRATLESIPLMKKLFEPIMNVIQNSGSYDEMLNKLADLYPTLTTDDLEELMTNSLNTVNLVGRWSIGG